METVTAPHSETHVPSPPYTMERRATRWELPELKHSALLLARRGSVLVRRSTSSPPEHRLDGLPELYAFGWNDDGQLGVGQLADLSTPELVRPDRQFDGKRIVEVACGKVTSMARTDDDCLYVWGENSDGRLALGNTQRQYSPSLLCQGSQLGKKFVQIACGTEHQAALTEDGAVVVWGTAAGGNLGIPVAQAERHATGFVVLGEKELHGRRVKQIACGHRHTLAVTTEGEVLVWGQRRYGVLGISDAFELCEEHDMFQETPVLLDRQQLLGQVVVRVAAGEHHNLALTAEGQLLSWGSNMHGELGVGHREICYETHPILIPPAHLQDKRVVDIACGKNFSMAVTEDGCVFAWGDNHIGQLGLGHSMVSRHTGSNSRTVVLAPTLIPRESFLGLRVAKVFCGGCHAMALTVQGRLFIWGRNSEGFLGLGHNCTQASPALIPVFYSRQVLAVACGHAHSLVLVAPGAPLSPVLLPPMTTPTTPLASPRRGG